MAPDGDEALTILATSNFDIALLDIKLPKVSGMDVLREIRANHSTTVAIMLTAVNEVDTAVKAMSLGASDYIVKPFSLDRVRTSIQMLLVAKSHPPEQKEREMPHSIGDIQDGNQATSEFFSQMDAIAHGVEANYDMLIHYSDMVVERTTEIARQLDIPDKEIKMWATSKSILYYEKMREIESALDKLRRSPLAQNMIGMTETYFYTPESFEKQN